MLGLGNFFTAFAIDKDYREGVKFGVKGGSESCDDEADTNGMKGTTATGHASPSPQKAGHPTKV